MVRRDRIPAWAVLLYGVVVYGFMALVPMWPVFAALLAVIFLAKL
jgi:hypothetical protein